MAKNTVKVSFSQLDDDIKALQMKHDFAFSFFVCMNKINESYQQKINTVLPE